MSIRPLQPLLAQGGRPVAQKSIQNSPSTPARAGWTLAMSFLDMPCCFNPCSRRVDFSGFAPTRPKCLQPLLAQGGHRPVLRHRWVYPSTPARAGWTVIEIPPALPLPFNPCSRRVDRLRDCYIFYIFLQPLLAQGGPQGREEGSRRLPSTPARAGWT